MDFDPRTRIEIDNSKSSADFGNSVSIGEIASYLEDGTFAQRNLRFALDGTKSSADFRRSITGAEIAEVIAIGYSGDFSLITRLKLDGSKVSADMGISITTTEIGEIVDAINNEGDGGGGDFVPTGVNFDGSTWLVNDALTFGSDTGYLSFVGFMKLSSESGNSTFMVVDPENTYTTNMNLSLAGGFSVPMWDVDDSNEFVVRKATGLSLDTWHSFIFCGATNFLIGQKKGKLYIDDVDLTELVDNAAIGFLMTFANKSMWFGNDDSGTGITMDCALARIMPGVNLFNEEWDIPIETRRLFVTADNFMVDPQVATDSLGAGVVLFYGNAEEFPVNRGTGGAFTLTGTLTTVDGPPNA